MQAARRLALYLLLLHLANAGCHPTEATTLVGVEAGADVMQPNVTPVPPDPTPPASLDSVSPSIVFLARHAEIVARGSFSSFTMATEVDLGPGITITNLSAPASNFLAVDFGVDADAAAGPRDVTVVQPDGGSETAPGALTLAPPVSLTFNGTLAQGSIVIAHVSVVDPSIPLDTTFTEASSGQKTFPNLLPLLPAGLSAAVLDATAEETDVAIFIDERATGAFDFDLVSGPPGQPGDAHFPSPASIAVDARTPIALSAGVPAAGTVTARYGSGLFVYTPPSSDLSILDFTASSAVAEAHPGVLLLPASGTWTGELTGGALATWLSASTDPLYAVYFDDSGSTGAYSVSVSATTPAASAMPSPADSTRDGAVEASAFPFVLSGGQLNGAGAMDWIAVITGPGDAGKHLAVASAGDPLTSLEVTVYLSDGITAIANDHNSGPVHATSPPLEASSTYYVVFAAGPGFDAAHGAYDGIVRLQ